MPYTLMKGLFWVALAVLLGIFIGWSLRSVAARRQVRRARAAQPEPADLERLRARVADLEPIMAERDRLRAELEARHGSEQQPAPTPAESTRAGPPDAPPAVVGPDSAVIPDLAAAAAVLGRRVELDDLTVVEGIGPKIDDLCHGIGIRTWSDLATTEVSLLRTMLADAGSRFRSHDPSTWPDQASLLAAGRWEAFKALTDELSGGRAVTD